MTIIDFLISLPMWGRILILVIGSIWLLETLLLPFKINMYVSSIKRVETLLREIKGKIEVNKSIDDDYKKMVSLLRTFIVKDIGDMK